MMLYDNMLLNRLTPDHFLERTLRSINFKKLEQNIFVLEEDVCKSPYHHPAIRHYHAHNEPFAVMEDGRGKEWNWTRSHCNYSKNGVKILQRNGSLQPVFHQQSSCVIGYLSFNHNPISFWKDL
uniref:Uncharacterized protein n=1 Tax=Salix viminalis TaxID=40686 RepID=A0A6N2LL79_SALVM